MKNDLNGWTAYEEFMRKNVGASEVNIQGKIYLYGDGEFVNATPEEVAYINERIKRRSDFIEKRCQYWGESKFKLLYTQDGYKDEKPYPSLMGSSNIRNKKLRSMQEVAEFIILDGQYGDLRIKYKDGQPFLKTDGIYVTEIADERYGKELRKILLPMQREVEKENEKGEKAMNEWERERKRMERYKELYPKGTRIMLLNMGSDEKDPIESGARGTVLNVSVGGIDVKWDNGRGLSLIPSEDSFRTLTESELKQEERIKNGQAVRFGDNCDIVIPQKAIDCSDVGYFDELENDCWQLIEKYCKKFGIEMLPHTTGVNCISFDRANELEEKIIDMFQESGVQFKFEQDETEEVREESGIKMA